MDHNAGPELVVDDLAPDDEAPGIPVLRVRGDLDAANADRFRTSVAEAAASVRTDRRGGDEPEVLVLDLDAVSFCDSRGLSALLAAITSATRREVSLRFVAGPSSAMQRLLARTGLTDLLPLHSTAAAAADGPPSRLEQETHADEAG